MIYMLSDYLIKKHTAGGDASPATRAAIGKASGMIGIFCNLLLFALKLTAGILTLSVSLIADAVNNLSDASSNIIAFFGFKMAGRPADKQHPYGHGRYEYISALLVAVLILVIGLELLRSGIEKIIQPEATQFGWWAIGIMAFSVALKLWMMAFNRRLGKKINSEVLTATAADSRNDAIATFAVLVAAVVSRYTGVELDGYMGVAVALFVLYSGIMLIRDTLDPLLGKAPEKQFVESIRQKILSFDGVLGTHDLMVHDYGPGRQFASVHVEVSADKDLTAAHEITDRIERYFLSEEGLHLVVHADPIPASSDNARIRDFLCSAVKSVDNRISIHDLRVVPCGQTTKLIFDCVAPETLQFSAEELCARIDRAVKAEKPDYDCEITVDFSYAALPH